LPFKANADRRHQIPKQRHRATDSPPLLGIQFGEVVERHL
jgi:hypothetical protein